MCKLQCWAVIRNLNMPMWAGFFGITAAKGPGSRSSFRVAGSRVPIIFGIVVGT